MGEKWSHDEALGTILTPGMPKAAQDSKKGGKSDLLDPPLSDPVGGSELQEKVTWSHFKCFLEVCFQGSFSLILNDFRHQNGCLFGGVDMLKVL